MNKIVLILLIYLFFISCNRITERLDSFEVHGIDVSHHQAEISWDTVATQAVDFAFIKATEGEQFIDNCFDLNWSELRRIGIKRGAYHFFHPTLSPIKQANNFIGTVQLDYGDLPPVLDFEVTNNVSEEIIIASLKQWLGFIENHYKIRPIIYTNQKLYFKYILPYFQDYPIWMARYNTVQPLTLSKDGWKFWQYGNRGKIKGIEGFVDLNVFHGNLYELEKMSLLPDSAISQLVEQ